MRLLLLPFILLLCVPLLPAQTACLEGTVVDDEGNPIIGATVHAKTIPHSGTVTDLDGTYRLCGLDSLREYELVIAYTGYTESTTKVSADGRSRRHVLSPGAALEEVVVVGSDNMAKRSISNLFQGRAAGVKVRDHREPRGRPERYNARTENAFRPTDRFPRSTISTDVDRAAYANVRRYLLREDRLPPAAAVRTEELINYFTYETAPPATGEDFAVDAGTMVCPWAPDHQLLRINLRTAPLEKEELPPANLVFLIDVSGSMQSPDKLPLVKSSLTALARELRPQDRIAIVVYAGAAGLVLPSTPGNRTAEIEAAINRLEAGGSTAGAAGLRLAYGVAAENYLAEGANRVIIATDGDFNVGISNQNQLVNFIEKQRKTGVYLSVLGYGGGNYQGGMMQELADRGNGNHAYVDGPTEARRVLIEEFGGTLFTAATDAKLQLHFDDEAVSAYRLIGYENRLLEDEDFANDAVDAADIGAGHSVTVLYELIPARGATFETEATIGELRLRYKPTFGARSVLRKYPVAATTEASAHDRWAAAVAEFAMLLTESPYRNDANWQQCRTLAQDAYDTTNDERREEFLELIERAARLQAQSR